MTTLSSNGMDVDSLIKIATEWLSSQQHLLADDLMPLSLEEVAIAKAVGVAYPERVRVARLPRIPTPDHPALAHAASALGLFTPSMTAFAAGYVILLRASDANAGLLAHELRLVHHFESIGTVAGYLGKYIAEVFEHGYGSTPMEIDAARSAASVAQ